MPQLSYSQNPQAALYPGAKADAGPEDILTGIPAQAPASLVTITVANSTAYQFTFVTGAGNTTASFTSDASATKAEVVAGLLAAVNALPGADYRATNYAGDLVLMAKPGVQFPRAVTSTGAGTMTIAAKDVTIPFGVFVALDPNRFSSADPQMMPISLPVGATTKILGLAMHTQYFESQYYPQANVSVPSYPAGQAVNVARTGRYWVLPEVAVTAGDPVFARHTTNGGFTQLGAVRNDADTANAIAISGRFLSSAAAGAFAVVEINLP